MKKQKTLEEKKVRKEALKMTAIFLGMVVILETVVFMLISFVSTHIMGLAFERTQICIGIVCFDIVLAIIGYFDSKREVIEWQKNDKKNGNTE